MANAVRPYAPDGSATTVSSPMSSVLRRSELLDTYTRPYGRWMPHMLRGYGVHRVAGAAALLAVLGVLAELVFERGETMLAFAVAAAAITVVYALWVSLNGVLLVRERTAEWRGAGGELARVRARRPHAGDTDPDAAHDEYAVAVDEGGRLVTFAFMPLAASEDAAPTSVLIPGVPRYEAREVATMPYDPIDAARAAEQLADAQEEAALLELEAISRARAQLEQDEEARELMAESLSTGAALRNATGQDAT
jgi:hypothetical protein